MRIGIESSLVEPWNTPHEDDDSTRSPTIMRKKKNSGGEDGNLLEGRVNLPDDILDDMFLCAIPKACFGYFEFD